MKGDRRSTDVISYLRHAILTLLDGLISLSILYRTPLGLVRSAFIKHTLALITVSFGKTWSYLLLRNITINCLASMSSCKSKVSLLLLSMATSLHKFRQNHLSPSSCQDGVCRLVFAGSFVQLNHPGVTVDATLQFSYQAPTPSYLYTTCTTLEWLSNYASGRR